MKGITNNIRELANQISAKYDVFVDINHSYYAANVTGTRKDEFQLFITKDIGGKYVLEYMKSKEELIELMQDILGNGYEKYLK